LAQSTLPSPDGSAKGIVYCFASNLRYKDTLKKPSENYHRA